MSNSQPPRILAFAGSARQNSFNKRLVRVAAAGAAQAGAEVTLLDLREHPMPLYDGDLEAGEGYPDSVRAVRALLLAHDGFLIASPEYNGSLSPLLKNVIDWCSRPVDGQDGLAAYRNKVVVLMSASPGGFGGLRGLPHLRTVLSGIGAIVLPDQIALPKAHEAFDAEGNLVNDRQQTAVRALGETLARTLVKLRGQPVCAEPAERRHDLSRIG